MTSSSERSSSVFATPSAGRRILHKFASPFGPKARSISEFTVNTHDPHKQYSPGETVTGAVVVKVVKPVRLTHISVCLHGFVQVYKTPGSPAESVRGHSSRIGKAQGKKSGEYFGNGFASLFEDETVLCGEGRLAEGSYRFDFEVTFPKDMELPSSIEFERGTISYMVTATLTRPTTMNPTISHDQRLYLCEHIDIANLLPPKSRTITLEPVSRKSRPRGHSRKLPSESQARTAGSTLSGKTLESSTSSAPTLQSGQSALRTPSISEASLDSAVSSATGPRSTSGSGYQLQRRSDSLHGRNGIAIPAEKTITATVESLKGGCLRGDAIPVRILVSHTKHIKSINGAIITLYRLARVDLHPALPLGPMSDGQKRKYEDYYPKSLTGLGGLSLSGTGSSHVFRKDLAQSIVPLIVDPQSLKSEINARIRVPVDAFPTINNVPGSMISFRYYIEVVLDIQGKLGANDKLSSQRSGTSTYASNLGSPLDVKGSPTAETNFLFALQSPGILDTAPIRRDKSVVTSVFEVVVGTLDSERRKGKARAQTPPEDENVIDTSNLIQHMSPSQATPQSYSSHNQHAEPYSQPEWYEWHSNADAGWTDYPNGYDDYIGDDGEYYDYDEYDGMPQFVPPPPMENEEELSDKERLRRAEARLMPSQPPIEAQNSASDLDGPSVPNLPLAQSDSDAEVVTAGSSRVLNERPEIADYASAGSPPFQTGLSRRPGYTAIFGGGPLEPRVEPDDKQEMQRRQLQSDASAPPDMNAGDGTAEACVPILDEDRDERNTSPFVDICGNNGEHLPQYTR